MVPLWKRALSRAMTRAISAFSAPAERRAPDVRPPSADPWYEAHEDLDAVAPGTVLDHRPVKIGGSLAFSLSVQAWQVRYRSNDTAGRAISSVATVIVPTKAWKGHGPRPLVSYQCAIDSLGDRADPSYALQKGAQREFLLWTLALRRGFALVTADYTGPRHACFAGIVAAHITLDGVRAALALEPAGLGPDTPIGLWGYSGGGQATAWAGELHPQYAPELRIAGVAAGGVPTDIRSVHRIDGGFLAGFALAAWVGVSREYPALDLVAHANDEGRRVLEEIEDMTVEELIGYFPFRRVGELLDVPDPFKTEGALAVNELLSLGRHLPSAPTLIYHSIYDQLVPLVTAEELAEAYRQGGVDVTLRRSRMGEHVVYHRLGAWGALRYLAARFADPPPRPEAAAATQPSASA